MEWCGDAIDIPPVALDAQGSIEPELDGICCTGGLSSAILSSDDFDGLGDCGADLAAEPDSS